MKENVKTNVIQMAQLAMMTAISVVLVAFVRIPLIPAAGFLIYDMADVPILIAALVFGTVPALVVLFLVSTIQAFLFSPDGWVGLVVHFVASGALVVLVGEFYKRRQKMRDAIIGMVLGTIAMTILMIPMNYIFTVNIYGIPKATMDTLIWIGVIPFNLLKAALNSVIAGVVFRLLLPFFRKFSLRLQA